jgi:5-methylcytosine-specific restriction enzyme subunit McrC
VKLIHLTEGGDWQDEELTGGQETVLRGFGLVDVRSGSGRCRVKAKGGNNGWAGAVRLGTGTDMVELRVKPKIPIARLLYLVGYTRTSIEDLRWRDDEIDVGEADELVPAVAHAFARAASRTLRQGLLLGYRETEETSMVVRGGIRAGDQMRKHYSFPLPAEIRFDDYTADIPENQLLRAAAERLLTVPHVPPVTVTMLRRLLLRFTDVSRLSPGHPLPEWRKNRLNARYHTALGLAGIVL